MNNVIKYEKNVANLLQQIKNTKGDSKDEKAAAKTNRN